MGLGKTLQSLCMIAGDHYIRTKAYKVRNSLLDFVLTYCVAVCS